MSRGATHRDAREAAADELRKALSYPDALPITAKRDELLAVLAARQVVIVAGETGSGKSTQLPKMCVDGGRGVNGLIGHTQPRRVAARTIAERVAHELGVELGGAVGYTVRFSDRVGPSTIVKVMTDGVLLAEIQRDRMLTRYDTLIIDEAHERSLNIDFLLGYLKRLLERRDDLKLIITSATIDTERFSAHFADAPIVEVTGRTFPVEVRYRPLVDAGDNPDQVQAICDAVDELASEGSGDVLVFLSGEREIHDTADALRQLERPSTEILPLYARLSAGEQHRIFQPHTGRRVVLATNVAETSLTVPGVRYVVDTGTARISRYSHRLKVQRLPIEAVSQASANQRAGRCGRVAPGICIRLFDEDDFDARPEFTEPEILRTNLASVILQMTALGLGDVASFPFLDPPDSRAVRDGVALLEELGALAPGLDADQRTLTKLGRRLARLPIDPRFARMVIEAERHSCVREVMIIAAALSIQDPRERPTDKQQAADESHRRFVVDGSDFAGFVKLWDYLRERQQELSSSQFRRMCRSEFLNYVRVREWQDLYRQLREATAGIGITTGITAGHPDHVHQALLAGLLSHMGMRDGESREFRGARNSKFMIAPGSALARRPPKWVMAAELVETTRLWGRVAAAIQPEWAEHLGGPLVRRSYGEPRWDERNGRAVVSERVTLYGLALVAARTVGFDRVDAEAARGMFIRHALVEGAWTTRHTFVADNAAFLDKVRDLADRSRRWHLIDDDAVFAFYDRRVGHEVVSTRHFDQWWKRERDRDASALTMTLDDLAGGDGSLSPQDYPDTWAQNGISFAVSYRFDPGDPTDGVTVHIPITSLNQLTATGFDWQVPGFRDDLVAALIRTLPKHLRRDLVPLANSARRASASLGDPNGPIAGALAAVLSEMAGEPIPASAFDVTRVPDHLRVTFSIEDDAGAPVATGKDLEAVRAMIGGRLRAALAEAAPSIERAGVSRWDFGDLPVVIDSTRGGHPVRAYPALLDDGGSVSIRVFSSPEIQAKIMPGGVRRLLLLTVPVARGPLERDVPRAVRLALATSSRMAIDSLIDDCIMAAADELIDERGGPPWHAAGFDDLVTAARKALPATAVRLLRSACVIVVAASAVDERFDRLITPSVQPAVTDARRQLDRLVRPGFVTRSGSSRLADLLRYVRAIERRMEKVPEDPARDRQRTLEISAVETRYERWVRALPPSQVTRDVTAVGWLIEELRVSLFAQTLGTSSPVSAKRITAELNRLGAP